MAGIFGHSGAQIAGSSLPAEFTSAEAHGLAFRRVRDDDLPFLAALYASTRAEELAQVPWSDVQRAAFLSMQFDAQHAHYLEHYPDADFLVIERLGAPVGRLYLEEWDCEFRIIDIAFMPDQRGQGLGGTVLEDVIGAAARSDKAVRIHVEKNNPAMSLYLRLGFKRLEDKGVYDLMEWRTQVKTAS